MTYPIPNYSRVWVRGRIIDLGKAVTEQPKYGVSGAVTFTPSVKVLVNRETQQIIASSPFRVNVTDDNGYFQIQLPATDDPDVIPTNFTFNVQEPGTGRSYNILVPQDTPLLNKPGDPLHGRPVIELSDVVPAPGPSSGLVQLVSGRGVDSIDIVDNQFVVTYSDESTHVAGDVPEGGAGYTTEQAQDAAAALLTSGGHVGVEFAYDDAANRITATVTAGAGGVSESDVDELIDAALGALAQVASTGAYNDLTGRPTLAVVATSGAYDDLSGRPNLSTVATSGAYTDLTGRPTLSTVATSGAYGDLSGKPAIPATYGDLSGVVPTTALPPLAISEVSTVASESAMLALTAQRGDVAVRTDNGRTYILSADTPATLTAWKEILATGQVQSVAGKSGVVTLTKSDVGLGSVDNVSAADLRSRSTHTGTQPASSITGLATVATSGAYNDLTGRPTIPSTKADVGLGNVDNTSDANKPVSTAQQAALNGKSSVGWDPGVMAASDAPRFSGLSREQSGAASTTLTSGRAFFLGFTAPESASVTTFWVQSRGTAAVGTTLVRAGLYTVDASGNLAMVARSDNTTSAGSATFSTYFMPMSAAGGYVTSYSLQKGQRYALSILFTGSTAPAVYGASAPATVAGWRPFLCTSITGQTDLAASYAANAISGEGAIPYIAVM